jgi:hypothetical protein
MKAITVCVDFHDYLAITLPRNARYFQEMIVVTSPEDTLTRCAVMEHRKAIRCSRIRVFVSTAFYRAGCVFNKGAAIADALERYPYANMRSRHSELAAETWWCLLDADVVLHPACVDCFEGLTPGTIYLPQGRRRCTNPVVYEDYADSPLLWDDLQPIPEMQRPKHPRDGGSGYCQVFHSTDPVLDTTPCYPTRWKHAGGCDTEFVERWPENKRARLPFEVLHLGDTECHWCGRRGCFLNGHPVPNAQQHEQALTQLWADRRAGDTTKETLS